jgi:hypothetical protein
MGWVDRIGGLFGRRKDGIVEVDPRSVLYSLPTISADLPELEPVTERPKRDTLVMDEDDWCQVELYAAPRLHEVQRTLTELKRFELANRTPGATGPWRDTFPRRLARSAVLDGPDALDRLAALLDAKPGPAPVLTTTSTALGRVAGAFTLPLGGDIALYGKAEADGITTLGASVGPKPDPRVLTDAFLKLHEAEGLLLVDWLKQFVLINVGEDGGVAIWKP